MWRVVTVINSLTDKPVQQDNLQDLFDLTWPRLASGVELVKSEAHGEDFRGKGDTASRAMTCFAVGLGLSRS
jgi:hypothetical protein